MFSWRTRGWNRKLTWHGPQELYTFVTLYLMVVMMMRWWNFVGLFRWWSREHVRGSCSIAATQKEKKNNENKDCFRELIGSWSAVSRRHLMNQRLESTRENENESEREREREKIWRVFEWKYLIFKRVFLLLMGDGMKKRRLWIVDSKIYGHIKRERERERMCWKMLTYGCICMLFICLWFYSYVWFLCRPYTT